MARVRCGPGAWGCHVGVSELTLIRHCADFAKDVKRESRRAKREIDRESRDMEREEAQLQADIKRYAAKGEHASARRLAKELVQLRNAKERAVGMKSAVGAMATRATVRVSVGARLAGQIRCGSLRGALTPIPAIADHGREPKSGQEHRISGKGGLLPVRWGGGAGSV